MLLNNFAEKKKTVATQLLDDFYVDDLVSGCKIVSEGREMYDASKAIMQEGGFELKKWVTNSAELREYISSKELDKEFASTQENGMTYYELL